MIDARHKEVARSVLEVVLNDQKLCFPRYREDIKTEVQANAATDLPLVYTWNQRVVNGQLGYSLSVNGFIIAQMLEKHVPRSDPAFNDVRDFIMQNLVNAQNRTVVQLCQKFQCSPKDLSGLLPS